MNQPIGELERKSLWRRVGEFLLSRGAVGCYWGANAVALLGAAAWILQDGRFPEGVAAYLRHIASLRGDDSAPVVVPPLLWPRVNALWCILTVTALSTVGIVAGLAAGSRHHRNTRSWLLMTLLMAGWLTLLTTWPQLVWRGQVWRVRGSISAFEQVANELLADWPDNDGDIPGLGPFMAYPIGKPRTLMFMATPDVPETDVEIKTLERGENDTLHFQLAGNEEGVWLVRESGDEPRPFFSGLDGEYIPVQFRRVSPGWFVVRYIYAPTVLGDPHESSERR